MTKNTPCIVTPTCRGEPGYLNLESKAIIFRDLPKKILFSKTICKLNQEIKMVFASFVFPYAIVLTRKNALVERLNIHVSAKCNPWLVNFPGQLTDLSIYTVQ